MKKLIFSIAFLLPVILFSQVKTSKEFKLKTGTPYLVQDAASKWYFANGDKMLAVKMTNANFTFQTFDINTLKEIHASSISKKTGLPKGYVHEDFIQQGNKVLQFFNVWDKSNKTEQIFVKQLDFNTPEKATKEKLIVSSQTKMKSTSGGFHKITLSQSFDKSKVLVTYELVNATKDNSKNFIQYGLVALDADMNVLWKKEVTMPYAEDKIENMGFTIDKSGNAYILYRSKKDDAQTPLEIMKVSSKEETKIQFEAGGKFFPRGIQLQEGENNKIFIAGYYGGSVAAQGIYFATLNPDKSVSNEKFHEIPLEIINQNKSDDAQEKAEKKEAEGKDIGIDHLKLKEIKVLKDGNIVMVGEVDFVITIPGLNSASNYFYYKEILISKIDPKGNLLWSKKLVKNQKATQSYQGKYGTGIVAARLDATNPYKDLADLSYKYITTDNSHYFLYVDHVDNLNLPDNKYPKAHRAGLGGFVTSYRVDNTTGDVTKLSLFDLRDLNGIPVFQFSPTRITQKNNKEFIIELYKKKKEDILLDITIEN